VTQSRESRDELEETQEQLRLLLDGIPDYGIFMLDPTGHVVTWNAGAQRIKGYTQDEVLGRHFSMFYTEQARASGHPDLELELAAETGRYEEEAWRVRKDGSLFWANVVITALRAPDGALRGFGKVTRDITESHEKDEALRQANDAALLQRATLSSSAAALAASEGRGSFNALLLRSAGEGFVAIDANGVCTSANPAAAQMLGYEVAELVGQDFHALAHYSHADGSVYLTADCPKTMSCLTGRTVRVYDEVFWRRDGSRLPVEYSASPMTEDGELCGVVLTFVDATDRRQASEATERDAARLRRGIRNGELVLHYQPQIDLVTGGCRSVEALVRWQREDRLRYPDEFISLAEQGGVIGELTDWVIDTAARQVASWRDDGTDLQVAVNLSRLSLTDEHIVHTLVSAADRHHIPVSQLQVEITESAAAENPDMVVAVLAQLSQLGVDAAIDDFGIGYSSLSYLKHLPVTELKVDKSFVMNMPQDTRDQAIVAATIHMAHSLGLRVVAEGVESDLIMRMLLRAGCDAGQGYHWSHPVPADQFNSWLTSCA